MILSRSWIGDTAMASAAIAALASGCGCRLDTFEVKKRYEMEANLSSVNLEDLCCTPEQVPLMFADALTATFDKKTDLLQLTFVADGKHIVETWRVRSRQTVATEPDHCNDD